MNCKELVYLLGDYLNGSMEDHLREDLDAHIVMCESCTNFLRTYDTTKLICRQVQLNEIPEEFRERLKSFVIEKAKEHHQELDKYRKWPPKSRNGRWRLSCGRSGSGGWPLPSPFCSMRIVTGARRAGGSYGI
ncbi:MAG: zf-HC2 domain-containing protein [Thermodesulfobacteriota bacterium]|nr:zf-HC2 domain-containing protein [Thermodesulfobacteriota bacterium]